MSSCYSVLLEKNSWNKINIILFGSGGWEGTRTKFNMEHVLKKYLGHRYLISFSINFLNIEHVLNKYLDHRYLYSFSIIVRLFFFKKKNNNY